MGFDFILNVSEVGLLVSVFGIILHYNSRLSRLEQKLDDLSKIVFDFFSIKKN